MHKVKEERGAEEAAAAAAAAMPEAGEAQEEPRPARLQQVDDSLPMQNTPEGPADLDRTGSSETSSCGTDAMAPL